MGASGFGGGKNIVAEQQGFHLESLDYLLARLRHRPTRGDMECSEPDVDHQRRDHETCGLRVWMED